MKSSPEDARPLIGLRERKKAKTRAAIQRHALRLFRAQGYEATTVEQIAEAAEVSPSTFFRYFPTKEDVVMYDELDPLIIEAFQAQPPDLGPMEALRGAFQAVFSELPPAELQDMRERGALVLAVPELRARTLDEFTRTIHMLTELIAKRAGRPPGDLAVRTFAGALIGAMMAAMLTAMEDPQADLLALLDAAIAHLENGLQL